MRPGNTVHQFKRQKNLTERGEKLSRIQISAKLIETEREKANLNLHGREERSRRREGVRETINEETINGCL